MSMEYDLIPGEPIVVEDLELALMTSPENESRAPLVRVADAVNPLGGISAEYTCFTR